ncbi:MAG TPA: Lrp/AsnC family transcriptional regulator [Planctomycetota bacterium]|nr:Lrp/AsnC family transcriptional regulator [Planctomycetota bacterium]
MAERPEFTPDETDLRILGALIADARQSYRQIARTLGVSVATVASHAEKLEKAEVVRRYAALVDYEKLGFAFPVIIEVKVAHGKLFDAERRIAQDPHVCMVLDHTGGTDATVIARFRNRETLDKFVKKIQSIPNVERTETKLVLNVIKDEPTGV